MAGISSGLCYDHMALYKSDNTIIIFFVLLPPVVKISGVKNKS